MSLGIGNTVFGIAGTGGIVSNTNIYTAGSTLVLLIGDDDSQPVQTPTGATWVRDANTPATGIDGGGNAWRLIPFYANNITGGTRTISYTSIGSSGPTLSIVEFLNADLLAPIANSTYSQNNALANPDLAVTSTAPNQYAISCIIDQRTADIVTTVGSGGPTWSMISGSPSNGGINGLVYAVAVAPVPTNGTATGPHWGGVAAGRTNSLWTAIIKAASAIKKTSAMYANGTFYSSNFVEGGI